VINVDLLSVIRRWHERDGPSLREITRRTGLSRNTLRTYLASGVTERTYPQRQSQSKLDAHAETLSSWLKRESRRPRKQRCNLKQLYHDLVVLGYTGSYDRVAAFARDWRQREHEAAQQAGRGTYVPLQFAPGEAQQFIDRRVMQALAPGNVSTARDHALVEQVSPVERPGERDL
jgi:hypothetical protein